MYQKMLAALLAAALAASLTACGKTPSGREGATGAADGEPPVVITTMDRSRRLRFKNVDAVTVTDAGLGVSVTIPVANAKAASLDESTVLLKTDQTPMQIKETIDGLDGEFRSYVYNENLRIEYRDVGGDLLTFTLQTAEDANGEKMYILSDSRAYVSDGESYYATVKLPYYYLSGTAFTALDYATFGTPFAITVSPADFKAFYIDSGVYAVKEGDDNAFSLEAAYFDESTNAYPIRFIFGFDTAGNRIVTMEKGTVSQERTTSPA